MKTKFEPNQISGDIQECKPNKPLTQPLNHNPNNFYKPNPTPNSTKGGVKSDTKG